VTRKSAIHVRGDLFRLGVFTVVCLMVMAVLAVQLSGYRFGDQATYRAEFDNVSALKAGDEVRIAGVRVGRVEEVAVHEGRPVVEFAVDDHVKLPKAVQARVRYKNLLGDRFLELTDGKGPQERLAPGGVIPVAQTHPALDLDSLLNGFQPLFRGLQPEEINKLSTALVEVFQGQGGTIEQLLTHVGSVTDTLADQDRTIGSLITNLNTVLDTVNTHGKDFSSAITKLQKLISGLAKDRAVIGTSFDKVGRITDAFAKTLRSVRPSLQTAVEQSDRTLQVVDRNKEELDQNLRLLPTFYAAYSRIGVRGAFTTAYICALRVRLSGADGEKVYTDWIENPNDRCAPGGP